MKRIKILAVVLALFMGGSCSDFLDVVPDEVPTEKEAFANPSAAERYLYSCYSYLPNPRGGADSLDWFTGDEVVTAFEHETFARFPQGNFTAQNPQISYWNTLFGGIKQCYRLINNIDSVPLLEESLKKDYKAQAQFLIGYYHFLLLKCYGPIILVKEEPSIVTPPEKYLGRSTYDECVDFIAEKLDIAIKDLPATRPDIELGLATSVAAQAIKGRMMLYAASPLFNGNANFYSGFTNKDGTQLINTTYDPQKWQRAKAENKKAIELAEKQNIRLYVTADAGKYSNLQEPTDPNQRALRFDIVDKDSPEAIWVDARGEGYYSLQNKSRPYHGEGAWNGIAPTLAMLDRFYTKNGLPIDQDPDFNYQGRFDQATFPAEDKLVRGEGETTRMNIGREPRYYAWVSFHGGYYEAQGLERRANTDNTAWEQQYKRGVDDKKLITYFTRNGNSGRKNRNNNYAPTGFLNKKGVHPADNVGQGVNTRVEYPWPIIRLAEVYLSYAEACVETNDLAEAKTYINKIRERAGIPKLEQSWGKINVALTQDKLREIVRQERMIELYLEHQNFWDMRRWLLAEKAFGKKLEGLNADGVDFNSFSRRTTLNNIIRNFSSPTHYLLPIPFGEIQKNANLVQNPGY